MRNRYTMQKLKLYLKRVYRLALNSQKQEELVWTDLKKIHADSDWQSGVYEKEKYIETMFEISDGIGGKFYYMIYDKTFHCRVKILEGLPVDLITDLFILAAHFNNLLNNGVVIVNVNSQYVEYHHKRDMLIPLLYKGEIDIQLFNHYSTAKDVYSAFQRLVDEQEAPAIIIADLLKKNKDGERDAE